MASSETRAGAPQTTDSESGAYASVHGLMLYYETYGSGTPLILLHGGVMASESFGANLERLATTRQVIAVHLQGHGRTRDIDRPWRYESMADDVAALIAYLGFEQADVLGYSMGGGVALQTATRHPEKIRKLVVVSHAMSRAGWFSEVLASFDQMAPNAANLSAQMAQSPFAERYPDIDWTRTFTKLGDMQTQAYDWSAEVATIVAPTMLIFADADSIRLDHIAAFYKQFGGGERDAGLDGAFRPSARLAIVPGTTHYDILSTTAVADLAASFLDAAPPAAT